MPELNLRPDSDYMLRPVLMQFPNAEAPLRHARVEYDDMIGSTVLKTYMTIFSASLVLTGGDYRGLLVFSTLHLLQNAGKWIEDFQVSKYVY